MGMELVSGNRMTAWGALAAGCDFFAGYPITPSSEIYAEMIRSLPDRGGVAVGAPDEISSLSYAVGASMTGRRAMTATSGPGWSLMIETMQYAIMTETPVVIVVVQRLGPATGGATQGAQGDVLFVEHATSGGYPIPVLAPADAAECFSLTAKAFDWAERLRTPIVVLSDKEVGTTIESVDLAALSCVSLTPRRTADCREPFVTYAISEPMDVPAFAPVGGDRKVTVTGSAHNQRGELKKNDPETVRQLRHLRAKIVERAAELECVRWDPQDGAETLIVSYGISARTSRGVARDMREEGRRVGLLEIKSLYPIPIGALSRATQGVRRVVVPEENEGGLYAGELKSRLSGVEVVQVNDVGRMVSPEKIREAVI